MENLSPLKIIKMGFFLGLGLMIPLIAVDVFMFKASVHMMDVEYTEYTPEQMEEYDDSYTQTLLEDYSKNIDLGEHTTIMQGKQLLILGKLTNKNEDYVSSISIEAELYDADNNFVYECSEFVRRRVQAGESENYQIKCGCNKNGLPEYERISLRVIDANRY